MVTCEHVLSSTDPLLLQLMVANVAKRVDTTEQRLELALQWIESLEQQLNQMPPVLPLPAPVPR